MKVQAILIQFVILANVISSNDIFGQEQVGFLKDRRMRNLQAKKSYSVGLTRNRDSYTADLYVGSTQQKQTVFLDTRGLWTTIESVDCFNCPGLKYNETRSTTFKVANDENTLLNYLSCSFLGYTGTERLSLGDRAYIANDVPIFMARAQNNLASVFDGVLGLAREINVNNSHRFITILQKANAIQSRSYSLFIPTGSRTGNIDIGDPVYTRVKSGINLSNLTLITGTTDWVVRSQKFIIGYSIKSYENDYGSSNATFDLNQRYIVVPQNFHRYFVNFLTFNQRNGVVADKPNMFPCDPTLYPTVFLQLGNFYFEIRPESFVINENDGSGLCVIGFVSAKTNSWILGQVFLNNYYTYFDDLKGIIGIAPHSSSKATITPITI
ncbi:cathepsin d [Stylonychia lemnae]|uniref:Cathepsin d n=1 Tax=Stylonychia lemnae TaxID=5949 RepID=A0A077ZS14_STYLE|nr:cathepsin d [Stylonychia lemnae]|eukprot:CDW72150.1 cathepsin d [Stylonychia lemnae]